MADDANLTSVSTDQFPLPPAALPDGPLSPWPSLLAMYLQASVSSSSHEGPVSKAYGHRLGHPTQTHPSGAQSNSDSSSEAINGMFQLLVLSLASTCGTMGSIFVISAMCVIETFQVRGNAFLASYALGHLLVTVFVLPASCVAIMAGVHGEPSICHYQWLATETTLLISVLSLTFMALENFKGLRSAVSYDLCCTKFRIVSTVLLVWLGSFALVGAQHAYGYGPNLCPHHQRKADQLLPHQVWMPYHIAFGVGLIVLPTLLAMWYFTRGIFAVKTYRLQMSENPQTQIFYLTDDNTLSSNAAVYCLFLLMWTPLVVVSSVNVDRPLSQSLLDTCWWIALANSCSYSFLYACTNKDFGEAFFKLFYYCCCKSHVSFTRKGPGFNIYAQRGGGQAAAMVPMGTPAPRAHSGHHGSGAGGGGYGMVALGQGVSGGGMMGGGPFRAFRSGARMSSDL